MKDNVVEVRLWDKVVGLLSWDEKQKMEDVRDE